MQNRETARKIRNFTIAAVFLLGIEDGGFQLVLVEIAEEYGLSATAMGMLVMAQYAAMLLVPPVFGRLGDRIGKQKLLRLFVPVLVIGCATVLFSRMVAAFCAGIFLVGAGYSILESQSSAALSDADPGNAERNISLTQSFYSIGCMASPLAVRFLLVHGYGWRSAFGWMMAGFALLLPALFRFRFDQEEGGDSRTRGRKENGSGLFCPAFLFLTAAIGLYSLLEIGFSFFLDYYFRGALNAGAWSAYALAAFWLAQAGSRMLFGLRCGSPSRTLIVLYLLSAGCVLLFTVVRTAPLALGLSLAAGFAFGPVWPMLLGTGTANFPDSSGTASGIMMAFSGLGGTVASVLLGWIADRTDVRMSMLALGVLSLLGAGSCMAGIRILSGRRTGR